METKKEIYFDEPFFGLKAYVNENGKFEISIFGLKLTAGEDNKTEFENIKQSSEGIEVELSSGEKIMFPCAHLFWRSEMAKGNTKKEVFENFSSN